MPMLIWLTWNVVCRKRRHSVIVPHGSGTDYGNFPDWSIIIVRSNFKKNQEESLKDLARFFKEYMPRYGYKYLCTEADDYKYYQTLGLKLIYQGIFDQNNYGLPMKDLNV